MDNVKVYISTQRKISRCSSGIIMQCIQACKFIHWKQTSFPYKRLSYLPFECFILGIQNLSDLDIGNSIPFCNRNIYKNLLIMPILYLLQNKFHEISKNSNPTRKKKEWVVDRHCYISNAIGFSMGKGQSYSRILLNNSISCIYVVEYD